VEVAVFNLFAGLWETEEGAAYSLSRKNDIFSGLGERDGASGRQSLLTVPPKEEIKPPADEQDEEFVRVEEILETVEEQEGKKPSGATEPEATAEQTLSSENEEELLSQELKRAECIVETFRDVKVRLSLPFSVTPTLA
jgi:hypothetical protein